MAIQTLEQALKVLAVYREALEDISSESNTQARLHDDHITLDLCIDRASDAITAGEALGDDSD